MSKKQISNQYYFFCLLIIFQSCANLKQNILFQSETDINQSAFEEAFNEANKNYTIEKFDNIAISVFTNNGEILVDPNREFQIGNSQNSGSQSNNSNQQNIQQFDNINSKIR